MSTALESSLGIVAYLVLFAAVGMAFLFVNLLVGWLLRPSNPNEEKLEVYECGERAIGSSFVQFDLRFYVVALLFIIFDVEIAFFFPWATVFGKANDLHDMAQDNNVVVVAVLDDSSPVLSNDASYLYRELGIPNAPLPLEGATSLSEGQALVPASLRNHEAIKNATSLAAKNKEVIQRGAKQLAWVTTVDIAVFFAVLLVGFAYVWKRGDLNWVRALGTNQPDPQS
jgi:NADH-quinone oxidoreductase subunit A